MPRRHRRCAAVTWATDPSRRGDQRHTRMPGDESCTAPCNIPHDKRRCGSTTWHSRNHSIAMSAVVCEHAGCLQLRSQHEGRIQENFRSHVLELAPICPKQWQR
eukprot:360339-Chlamydomonas_euryale.AAC.8